LGRLTALYPSAVKIGYKEYQKRVTIKEGKIKMVVSAMNLKEQAYKIIDEIPEEKMAKIIAILENLKELIEEELDEFDIQLIEEAEKTLASENENEFIPFEKVLKETEIDEEEILSDVELIESIKRGLKDIENGDIYDFEDVFKNA
jgi:formate dehydrogenase maturation protein FdhE